MIYLDSNATTPMKPAVRASVAEAMERHGTPSSAHRYGRIARKYVDDSRAKVAALIGARASDIVFTGSGSEANSLILSQFASPITSCIEHDSVRAFSRPEHRLPVTPDGRIDVQAAESVLRRAKAGSLVSVMLVNHETGVIQPLTALVRMAKKYGHFVHVDAAQAAARLPVNFMAMGVDAMTISAHKFGGPQGIGALVIRDFLKLNSLVRGEGQEKNRRSGTENVAGIIGFGVAAQLAADDLRDRVRLCTLRDRLEYQLCAIGGDDVVVIGAKAPRIANTLLVALPGISGEEQVASMDLAGIAVGGDPSRVLGAMGYAPEIARCAMRISLCWHTQNKDIDRCIEAWKSLYQRTRTVRTTKAA